jgi:hypothetical protein
MIHKAPAEKIVRHYCDAVASLNKLLMDVREHGSQDEVRRYDAAVSKALATLYRDILQPVLEAYPELTPQDLLDRR